MSKVLRNIDNLKADNEIESNKIHGSINMLGKVIEEEGLKVPTIDMVMTLPSLVETLADKQQKIFTAFYMKQMSVNEIAEQMFGFQYYEVEMSLKAATTTLVELLRRRYSKINIKQG